MTKTHYRVGILGAGAIAGYHAAAVRAVRGAQIVAVCDVAKGRADNIAESVGANSYTSLDEMLAAEHLDVVHVLVPPDSHWETAKAVVDAGAHVLLEKPMGVAIDECSRVVDDAATRKVHVGVNHNFLFYPIYEQLRNDLREGKLGRVDQVTITWHYELPQIMAGPFDLWMLRDPKNIMLEIGAHPVSVMLDLVGVPHDVVVRATNPIDLPGGERFYRRWQVLAEHDTTSIVLNFSFVPGFPNRSINVRGSLGLATADIENNTYLLQRHGRLSEDLGRYGALTRAAKTLRRQARRNLIDFSLAKAKLSEKGNAFAYSIVQSVRAFYGGLDTTIDERVSGSFGCETVEQCIRIAALADVSRSSIAISPRSHSVSSVEPQVLVLGGTGFIGRVLVRQLTTAGHSVRVMARNAAGSSLNGANSQVELVRGTTLNNDDLMRAMAGVKCVYHLARANASTWSEYCEQDVLATRNIAECVLKQGVERLIYTGTIDSCYAGTPGASVSEEAGLDAKIHRRNNYARAKAAGETLLLEMHREQQLPAVIVRPGIVIGTGGNPFHPGVGTWTGIGVCQVCGSGNNPLPIVLVEDVARGLYACMTATDVAGEAFNLVGESLLTARDYLSELEKLAGIKLQIMPTPLWRFYAGDLGKYAVKVAVRYPNRRSPGWRDWKARTFRATFDCSKACRMLDWQPCRDKSEVVEKGIGVPVSEYFA